MMFILAEKRQAAEKLAQPYKHKKYSSHIEIYPCSTFPKGAYVGYCIGHLLELYYPGDYKEEWVKWTLETLPIIPDLFKFKVSKGKEAALQTIKKLANDPKVTEICIATDPAREGENIAVSTLKFLGITKPTKRLWTSSLTESAVKRGFENLQDGKKFLPLYYEAHARQIADWLIGINLSRQMTLLLAKNGIRDRFPFPIGRVMTPVLKIIVEREKDISTFKSTPFWTITSQFQSKGKTFIGTWFKEEKERFDKKEEAENLLKKLVGQSAEVLEVKKERKNFKPPLLYNLSALQVIANKKFKYSPQETLEITQSLYDNEYVSYPRTDSQYVTEDEAREFPFILNGLSRYPDYMDILPAPIKTLIGNSRYVNPKKVSDHHAILPTEKFPNLLELSEKQRNIYDLIARSLIAAHYDDAIFDFTNVISTIRGETFLSKGKVMIQEGWRKVIFLEEENEEDKEEQSFPILTKGEPLKVLKCEIVEGKTKPPSRFTQGNIINVLKNPARYLKEEDFDDEALEKELKAVELGTEATRASIIEKLIQQNLIKSVKNQIYATERGMLLIEALGRNSILASPELTARWEHVLKQIGQGKVNYLYFIEKSKQLTLKLMEDLKAAEKTWEFSAQKQKIENESHLGKCPKCKEGFVVKKQDFYGCSQFSSTQCSLYIPMVLANKKISEVQIKKLLAKGKTDVIKGFKAKSGKEFATYLFWDEENKKIEWGFNEGKKNTHYEKTGIHCPICNNEIKEYENSYGCSGKSEGCKIFVSKTYLGKEIPKNEISNLMTKGKTSVLSSFVNRQGKSCNALLYIDEKEQIVKFKYL